MYLVISYKPDKTDTCMSCVVGRYSSDHRHMMFKSLDAVANHIAHLDVNEREDDRDSEWEHWVYTPESMKTGNYWVNSYAGQCLDLCDSVDEERFLRGVDRRTAALARERDDRERQREEAQNAKRREEQAAKERKELKRLLEKHGVPD